MISARILTSLKRFTSLTLISRNMPASIVKVPTIDSLHEIVARTVEGNKGKDIFLYYYASNDPATGKSWCPDCVRGKAFCRLAHTTLMSKSVPGGLQVQQLNVHSSPGFFRTISWTDRREKVLGAGQRCTCGRACRRSPNVRLLLYPV